MTTNKNAPYYKAAEEALVKWNGFSPETAKDYINNKTFEEIEKNIHAKDTICDASNSIVRLFWYDWEHICAFRNYMLGFEESKNVVNKIQTEVQKIFDRGTAGWEGIASTGMILGAADMVHRQWAKRNEVEFFGKKAVQGKEYQFLPYEFIGINEVKSDLLFIKPVAEEVGLKYDELEIEKEYERKALNKLKLIAELAMKEGYQIASLEDLIRYTVTSYPGRIHLSSIIADQIEMDDSLVKKIGQQIREKGIGKDHGCMEKIDSIIETVSNLSYQREYEDYDDFEIGV